MLWRDQGMSARLLAVFGALSLSCASPDPSDEHEEEREGEPSVEIGVPSGDDGLDFAPLEPGAELRLQTFGQGGTHVFLGVRCIGFGTRAYVTIRLRNLSSGIEITSPAPPRPQLLYCNDEGVCDLVPMTVMTGGLTEMTEERDGLRIEVAAEVHNDAGAQATDAVEAVLSTADL
jgi:hypothetical protein